jgi:serine/threonine-protein kinase
VTNEGAELMGIPGTGEIIASKYRVEERLGAGGMGVVLAARHLTLGQRFAIKLLQPEAARHPAAAGRFMREARAAAGL